MTKRSAGGTPRSTARLAAVQALYQMEISGGEVEQVIAEFAGHRLDEAVDGIDLVKPDRALFQDIRRYFPITCQAEVAWAVTEGISAATQFIEDQIEAGALDGGVARCRATTRKGKPCQRTPLPERDYCPSHQHLEAKIAAKAAA